MTMTPQQTAEHVGRGMLAHDEASRGLGMRVEHMGPGTATLTMVVRPDMLNGFRICHGGFIATLADSAFAFACNSYNELTVAAGFAVDFISQAKEGDTLSAEAREVALTGRTGLYDVAVHNQHGGLVASFRGRSHRLKDRMTVPVGIP
jgi:acyl-CoA thioesterase